MSASTTWLPWMLKLLIVLVMAWLSRCPEEIKEDEKRRVQILVLGDIGRSPRMQYHALSIAKHGGQVDLIGYQEAVLHPRIVATNSIKILPLSPFPAILKTNSRGFFVILGPLKVLFQMWTLWSMLQFRTPRAGWMLVQNPPSIPTLAVALLVCHSRKTRLVIDWHNFGYSILALRLGSAHPLVHISRLYERFLVRFVYAHLCVTDAMARILEKQYKISSPVLTLHDRPCSTFQPVEGSQRSHILDDLFKSLLQNTDVQTAGKLLVAVKSGRTKLLASSTSWTPDEDFSLLLDALLGYANFSSGQSKLALPELLVVVTGKGPQRITFEAEVAQLNAQGRLPRITVQTAYFDSLDDYAKLLGCADLGISLHTSSSGVDLPMKVVDMFGAGLPVVGWGAFEAWPELVKEGVNGMSFDSAAKLEAVLRKLFGDGPQLLMKLRNGALQEGKRRWDDEWDPVAGNLFEVVAHKKNRKGKA